MSPEASGIRREDDDPRGLREGADRSLRILLRTDGSTLTGLGHFHRCLSLAKQMPAHGMTPHFIMKFASESTLAALRQAHIPCDLIPGEASWEEEARLLRQRLNKKPKGIIFDISHSHTMAHLEGIRDYVSTLRGLLGVTVLMDGSDHDAITKSVDLDIQLLITPYFRGTGDLQKQNGKFVHLNGQEFMVYQPEFTEVINPRRTIYKKALKVLLSFGGTDGSRLTLKALKGLSLIHDRALSIRVVVGPGFDGHLIESIRDALSRLKDHGSETIMAPPTLAHLLPLCDVALCTSGLTKYELAVTGTPGIILSLTKEHEKTDRQFAAAGTAVSLGFHGFLTALDIKEAVIGLLDDVTKRRQMSRCGLELFDPRGPERILGRVRQLCEAQRP